MDSSSNSSPSLPSLFQLKREARELVAQAKAQGNPIKHGAALEAVAKRYGLKGWNAASAAASAQVLAHAAAQPAARFAFEDVTTPLEPLPVTLVSALQAMRVSAGVSENIDELFRWARQLEFIAEKVDAYDRRDALAIIGSKQPYAFVRDSRRWPDGLFHLADRGYDPIEGVAFSRDEMEAAGVVAWEDQYGMHGGSDSFSVVHDGVITSEDATLLKRAARLVAAVAAAAAAKVYSRPAPR